MSNSTDGRSVTSKLAAIIRTFSSGNAHSLSQVARSADLPVSTAHRLTAELVEWGLLERTEDKNYRIGVLLAQIGTQISREPSALEHARRVLDDLSSATRTIVRFGVLKDSAVSYIEKRPEASLAPTVFESLALPAHATAMGKALLAFSSPETVTAVTNTGLTRYTPFTVVTTSALRRELAVIRMSQIASAREEFRLHTASIGVPVFGTGGRIIAAIELIVTGSGHQVHAFRPVLVVAAKGLSRQLTTSRSRRQSSGDAPVVAGRQAHLQEWIGNRVGGRQEQSGSWSA
jgi:DNA-binding IclR family transcriptional regulator